MKSTALLQEIRKMRFAEAFEDWQQGHLRQGEAARLLGGLWAVDQFLVLFNTLLTPQPHP
ncbi:MAG: hypothetical protein ACYC9L_11950 [Sulfuricaulis sp.]